MRGREVALSYDDMHEPEVQAGVWPRGAVELEISGRWPGKMQHH